MNAPLKVGLVGGVASGKSTVARRLAQRGAVVLDADKMAHQLLDDPGVIRALTGRWGSEVINHQGQVDRGAVAQRVFGADEPASEERKFLEGLLHPRVRRRVEEAVEEAARAGAVAVVIDAPLLLEAGWADACDEILLVDSPQGQRRARAQARGWSISDFTRREASQMPIREKKTYATHVMDNSGDLAELNRRVDDWWNQCVEKSTDD